MEEKVMKILDIKNQIQEAQRELEIAKQEFKNATKDNIEDAFTRLELAEGNLERLYETEKEIECSE